MSRPGIELVPVGQRERTVFVAGLRIGRLFRGTDRTWRADPNLTGWLGRRFSPEWERLATARFAIEARRRDLVK